MKQMAQNLKLKETEKQHIDYALNDASKWLNELPAEGIHINKRKDVAWSRNDFGVRMVLSPSYPRSIHHLVSPASRMKLPISIKAINRTTRSSNQEMI